METRWTKPDEGGTKQTDTPTPANERFCVRNGFSSYVLKFEANVSNNHWQGYAMSVETFRVVFGRVGACCVHIQSCRYFGILKPITNGSQESQIPEFR